MHDTALGVQLADLAAGAFYATLRGHDIGPEVYWNYVEPRLRFSDGGDPFGYGIVVVPRTLGGDHTMHRDAVSSRLYDD